MHVKNFGNSALKVSEITLGSWLSVGGKNLDENTPGSPSIEETETGLKLLKKAVDLGVNSFDTAPGYGKGNAERMIGEFMKDYNRDDFVIATKIFFGVILEDNRLGTSKKGIHINLKDSLERLQTDYVDIYYCHQYDNIGGKVEETIRAMNHMIDQGKILYWATSNWTAAEIERAYGICKAEGLHPPIVDQAKYSLLSREIELSHMSTIDYTKIGIAAYSPLEEGILTGKYNFEKPSNSRAEKLKGTVYEKWASEHFEKMLTDENQEKLKKLEILAKELEISMAQMSIAWVLSQGFVDTAIVGASKTEHLEENTKASTINLDNDTIQRIEEIMDNEPQYQGDHARWIYNNMTKALKKNNYRIPSVSRRVKQEEKEKEKETEEE